MSLYTPVLSDLNALSQATSTGVPSSWREEKNRRGVASSSQTEHSVPQRRPRGEAEVQASADARGVGCQTDTDMLNQDSDLSIHSDANVASFLMSVAPRVEEILTSNVERFGRASRDSLDLLGIADEATSQATAEHLYTFRPFVDDAEMAGHGLVCTSLSWSCTGNSLAASFGRYDIEGWCNTPGALCVWNIGDGSVDPTTKGSMKVEKTETCLMCCTYHPAHPALIAGGTFDGEICIWDARNVEAEDMQRARSQINQSSHREPVTAVAWRRDAIEQTKYISGEKTYLLVTLGAEGRLLIWIWHERLRHPTYGYELRHASTLPDGDISLIGGIDTTTNLSSIPTQRQVLLGGTCLSFGLELGKDQTSCIVGTDSGGIYKCAVYFNEQMAAEYQRGTSKGETDGEAAMQSPIKYEYERHAGPVLSVDCCRSHRRIFASGGMDGTVRLYDALKREPLMTLQPSESFAHGVRWSPHRPTVLAVATGDGFAHLYDFNVRHCNPDCVACGTRIRES